MYIFFLLINFTFSGIFYIFGKLVESIFFLITGIIMFFYFSPLYFGKKSNKSNILSKVKISADTFKKTIPLLQKVSYLIAFFFFYVSLYGISYSFGGTLFPLFTLIISLIISVIFYSTVKKQKPVIGLIHRSNYFVFSFIYFILFIKKMVYAEGIDNIFITNTIVSFIGLLSVVILDKNMEQIRKNAYFAYMLTYFNLISIFYIDFYFKVPFILLISYILFVYSIFYFEFLGKIKYLIKFDISSKYYGLLINYISCFIALAYLFIYENYWHFVIILFGGLIFNFLIHQRLKNYFSFTLVLISIIALYIKYFIPLNPVDFLIYIIFIYLLPGLFIGYTFIFDQKHENDNFIIHSIGILFSITTIIVYLTLSKDFSILHLSIIFLLQSFLLFGSFAKLKTK